MDMNVLSKLSSKTDIGQTPSEQTSPDEGFAVVFKASDPTEPPTVSAESKANHSVLTEAEQAETQTHSVQNADTIVTGDAATPAPAKGQGTAAKPELITNAAAKGFENERQATNFEKGTNASRVETPVRAGSLSELAPPAGVLADRSSGASNVSTAIDARRSVSDSSTGHHMGDQSGTIPGHTMRTANSLQHNTHQGTETVRNPGGANSDKAPVLQAVEKSIKAVQQSGDKITPPVAETLSGVRSQSIPSTGMAVSISQAPNSALVTCHETKVIPTPASGLAKITQEVTATPNTSIHPSMTLVERHLGGHAVRLVPQHADASVAHKDIRAAVWSEADMRTTTANMMTSPPTPVIPGLGRQLTHGLANTVPSKDARAVSPSFITTEFTPQLHQGDVPHEAVWDVRSSATTPGTAAAAAAPRTELAASVSQQIVDAMRKSTDKSVEIALNPVELGRVRMILSPSDAGVTMNILADRPDTLELMRRNIDDLTKSLAELGYENISFSFGHSDQASDGSAHHQQDQNEHSAVQTIVPDAPLSATETTPHLAIAPDGIDMRL